MLISMRRRSQTDALAPVNAPRWLVVRDRLSRVVQSDALPPLRGICRAAMQPERARRAAAGWAVDDIPRKCSFFFCELENERVCVSIECFEPGCGELAGVADTTVRRHIELSGFRKGVIT
jgi:hypothetical protein